MGMGGKGYFSHSNILLTCIAAVQGSAVLRDHGDDKDAALQRSRDKLKQSIKLAWSQVFLKA